MFLRLLSTLIMKQDVQRQAFLASGLVSHEKGATVLDL